jgi:hypothetical protein
LIKQCTENVYGEKLKTEPSKVCPGTERVNPLPPGGDVEDTMPVIEYTIINSPDSHWELPIKKPKVVKLLFKNWLFFKKLPKGTSTHVESRG